MKIEREYPYGSVVSDFFYVFEHLTESKIRLRPGLDLLVETLVRCGAYKVYIPYIKPRFGEPIDEVIKAYPPSLQKRIEIIDRKGKEYQRVLTYLEPIYEEIKESHLILFYRAIFDFLYKLLLASKYKAEADVSMARLIGYFIQRVREEIKNREAKIRLDQLEGIYLSYSKPLKIDTFTLLPRALKPSISERVADFLDEAEIIELSKKRYLLGIPNKAKTGLIKIKKYFKKVPPLIQKYRNLIRIAEGFIQISGLTGGAKIPNIDYLITHLELYLDKYNPPLTDLDYHRVQICKKISPTSTPNFMLPDGATRAISDEYFFHW
jgi:hypothetical protein